MKVIDLLNKIANEEEVPKIISYEGVKYHIDELERFYVNDNRKGLLEYIFDYLNDYDALNDYVEILEEDKKIEKLNCLVDEDGELTIEGFAFDREQKIQIVNKINEIIDYINKEKE